ncbi:MAG: RluA family pseudouridine synthase [Clostridia bacterium]|nr:RluA family pseudouridine synthase [Clostridia bacterium]
MNIIYEDDNLIICKKTTECVCELSQTHPSLANEIQNKYGYAGVIHRLDMNVGGCVLYAKNKIAASKLSAMVSKNEISKEYIAVVHGKPDEDEGEFCDLLFKDSSKNKVYTVKRMRKGVKEARLLYSLIETVPYETGVLSLVKIKLLTGRSHQIRVQFSSRKMSLVGDGKYGSKINKCSVALWSHKLEFQNPLTNETVSAISYPQRDTFPWCLFRCLKDE